MYYKSVNFYGINFFYQNYLSFEEKFTMIDQEKHEIEQIYTWNPLYYCINYV